MLNVNEDCGGLHKGYRNSLKSWALCLPLQEDEPPNPQRNPCQLWGSLAGDSKPAPSTEIKLAQEHNPAHGSEQQQNKNKNKKNNKPTLMLYISHAVFAQFMWCIRTRWWVAFENTNSSPQFRAHRSDSHSTDAFIFHLYLSIFSDNLKCQSVTLFVAFPQLFICMLRC